MCDLESFALLIKRGGDHCKRYTEIGKSVKTLHCLRDTERESRNWSSFLGLALYSRSDDGANVLNESATIGLWIIFTWCLGNLIALESLVVRHPAFTPRDLQQPISASKRGPLRFLSDTLKNLYIGSLCEDQVSVTLSGRNVIFLLVFSPHLRRCCLTFTFSIEDFQYLREYRDTFRGLSAVKQLSLEWTFISNSRDRRTFWDFPGEEEGRAWIGGTRQTEAASLLLEVTANLQAFELTSRQMELKQDKRDKHHSIVGSYSNLHISCLMGLNKSFKTLKHLRLFGLPSRLPQHT